MSTHVTTHNPVRSDLHDIPTASTRPGRSWALAGIGAGLAGFGVMISTGMVDAGYDPDLVGDTPAIADRLADQTAPMLVFHTLAMVSSVLLIVFAAGLHRRLRSVLGDGSTAPLVAFAGLLGTGVVSVLGSGLDTEFIFGLLDDDAVLDPANAVFYSHWIATIPWLWALAGLSGLAVYVASRAAATPRWIGWVGLVLGGLTLLAGISPLQYVAGFTGPLWLLVTATGFAFGDRAARS